MRRAPRRREPAHVILRRCEQKLDELMEMVGRNQQADKKRDDKMAKTAKQVLEAVRAAATVSAATNVGMREVVRILKEQEDPANDEAIAILEGMTADDQAIIKENTPEAPPA